MLFKVRVKEVVYHDIMVEADSEEEAWENWWERFGDSDFDEIGYDEVEPEAVDIEEAE